MADAGGIDAGELLRASLERWRAAGTWHLEARSGAGARRFEAHVRHGRELMSLEGGLHQAYLVGGTAYLRGVWQLWILGYDRDPSALAAVTNRRWISCDRATFQRKGHDHNAFVMVTKSLDRDAEDVAVVSAAEDRGSRLIRLRAGDSTVLIRVAGGDGPRIIGIDEVAGDVFADITYAERPDYSFPEIPDADVIPAAEVARFLGSSRRTGGLRAKRSLTVDVTVETTEEGEFLVRSEGLAAALGVEGALDAEAVVSQHLLIHAAELLPDLDLDSYDTVFSAYAATLDVAQRLARMIREMPADQ